MTPAYSKATSLPQITSYVEMERDRLTVSERARYDRARARYDDNPGAYTLDDFPPCLQIEPTSICNYRCVFCYQTDTAWAASAHMGRMAFTLFQRAIDEATGRCEIVTLASRGEPLLHPLFPEMLAYTTGKFVALKVNTNGACLSERLCHALLEADLLTLVISAEATHDPPYSHFRVGGNLDRVRQNVERLCTIRATAYPHSRLLIRISGVQVPGTPPLSVMEAYWNGLADQVCFVAYNPWENTYARSVNEIATPCSDLWRRMFLWWDGTVNPCDVDYRSCLTMGRFPDSSLSDLWRSDQYQLLRTQHQQQERSRCYPCNRCTVV